jgi:(1->4)-alpha-D-glucan 1-alpha-D-glucosylmutase
VSTRLPASTYRLQINHTNSLPRAADLVDYLSDLGVGAVYLSPILQSTSGSDHGYDATDVTRVDSDRGGAAGWQQLLDAAARAGLDVVVDLVPNHLGISAPVENRAWWDVLTHGRASAYADWFDIDWSRRRITVPVLGDDATLTIVDGELRYLEHRFPLAPGTWREGDSAATVHDRQHYELMHFSRANTELNYRRFFAVTTLAGLRVELESVQHATHLQVKSWVDAGIAGLRIDHPDGLVDPGRYLQRLRDLAPEQWITVEKILEPGEELPPDWPVAGTTGYDAMYEVNQLFVDPDAEQRCTLAYQRLSGDDLTMAQHIEAGKRMVVTELFAAERHRMAALVPQLNDVADALGEVAVAFEVYRSYLPAGTEHLDHALAVATERRPDLASTLTALSPRLHDPSDELAVRMQQLSGATMAKGVEDTAYYRYSRFIALNEVGGNPGQFGLSVAEFHRAQSLRQQRAPESMTALSTHDTKRGEDVRARLAVLAELVQPWSEFAELFLDTVAIPNRAFGYFLAQTMAGTGPIGPDRIHAYAEKAMREASDGTSWSDSDDAFEAAVHGAVDLAYDDPALRAAWDDLTAQLEAPGWSNALGQKIVQLTMPGVPDVYQGTELWDDSLVDPDNRRPVDYAVRRTTLATADRPPVDRSGAAKLVLTAAALRLRRDRPELFSSYTPLCESWSRHLIAFDRGGVITVATRLPVQLALSGGWGTQSVTFDGEYEDVLTGRVVAGPVPLADLLTDYPVALLVSTT